MPIQRVAVIDPSLFTIPYDAALCEALAQRGPSVTLYGRRLRGTESLATTRARLDPFFYRASEPLRAVVPGVVFRAIKGAEHALDMMRLVRQLRRSRPEVVHFQWAPLPILDARPIAQIAGFAPLVLTVHDTTPFNGSGRRVQIEGYYELLALFDRLIVHSENGKRTLIEQGMAEEQIAVIPHGLLSVATPTTAYHRIGQTNILMFGKIKSYKGVDVMIEALPHVPANLRRNLKVTIVGEPHIPIAPLKERAEALGVADCLAWDLRFVSDAEMGAVLSQADIFAFPYREIDASGVFMSCVGYGRPIIASQIGAFERLLQNGEHGCLIPPGDFMALADAITTLLKYPYLQEQYGRGVAALGDAIPPWSEIAERTLEIYRSVQRQSHST